MERSSVTRGSAEGSTGRWPGKHGRDGNLIAGCEYQGVFGAKWPGKPGRDGNNASRPVRDLDCIAVAKWPGEPARDGNTENLMPGKASFSSRNGLGRPFG